MRVPSLPTCLPFLFPSFSATLIPPLILLSNPNLQPPTPTPNPPGLSGTGLTPLHYASVSASLEVVGLLLQVGAVMSKAGGSTPLEMVQACLAASDGKR